MRNWLAVLIITALGLIATTPVWGLGFGDIDVHSALGQPLDAEIQLLAVSPDERESLSVHLASPQIYKRFGVHRGLAVRKVRVQVVRGRENGRMRILLTSEKPIRSPFLVLLVEATWAGNRALREYTLLLDPPTMGPEPVSAPATSEQSHAEVEEVASRQTDSHAAPKPGSEPSPSPEPVASADSQAVDTGSAGGVTAPTDSDGGASPVSHYGPVGQNETLWSIASKTRPDPGITMEQMMLAIYQANTGKFGGNINVMYHGVMLTIPSADRIRAIDPAVAERKIRQQMSAYTSGNADSSDAASEAAARGSAPASMASTNAPRTSDDPSATSAAVGQTPDPNGDQASKGPVSNKAQEGHAGASESASGGGTTSDSAGSVDSSEQGQEPANTVAGGQSDQSGQSQPKTAGTSYGVVGGIGVTKVADQSGNSHKPNANNTSTNQTQQNSEKTQSSQSAGGGSQRDVASQENPDSEQTGNAKPTEQKASNATAPSTEVKAGSEPSGTESAPVQQKSGGIVSNVMGMLTQYAPKNIVVAGLAILALVVFAIIVLVAIRLMKRRGEAAEWVDLDKDIDQSGQLDTAVEPDLGMEPETDNKPRIEDILEDADTLMENDLHDDALSMIARGLESYPHESNLVRKRLQIYWTLGDRESFVEVVKRGDMAPDFEDPDWLQIAEWGHQLAPEEEVFMAPPEPDESEPEATPESEEEAPATVESNQPSVPGDVDLEAALADLERTSLSGADDTPASDDAQSSAIEIADAQSNVAAESGRDNSPVSQDQESDAGRSAERRAAPGPAVKAALESATGQAAGYDPGVSVMMPDSDDGENKSNIWGDNIDLSSFNAEGLSLEGEGSVQQDSDELSTSEELSYSVSDSGHEVVSAPELTASEPTDDTTPAAELTPDAESNQLRAQDDVGDSLQANEPEEDLDLAASIEKAQSFEGASSASASADTAPDSNFDLSTDDIVAQGVDSSAMSKDLTAPAEAEQVDDPQPVASDSSDANDSEGLDVKLDLARAYIEVGDSDMAKSLLEEVRRGGTKQQSRNAEELLANT